MHVVGLMVIRELVDRNVTLEVSLIVASIFRLFMP